MVERSMKHRHPDWSEAELKAAVFERIYRDGFPPDELERIKASLIEFGQRQSAILCQTQHPASPVAY